MVHVSTCSTRVWLLGWNQSFFSLNDKLRHKCYKVILLRYLNLNICAGCSYCYKVLKICCHLRSIVNFRSHYSNIQLNDVSYLARNRYLSLIKGFFKPLVSQEIYIVTHFDWVTSINLLLEVFIWQAGQIDDPIPSCLDKKVWGGSFI